MCIRDRFRTAHAALFLDPKTDLDGVVAIGANRFDLGDGAGARLYYSDGNQAVRSVIHLGHAHFFTEED